MTELTATSAPLPVPARAGLYRLYRLFHLFQTGCREMVHPGRLQFPAPAPYLRPMSETASFGITERAAHRVAEIVAASGTPGQALRVAVLAGGCSGFQYRFELDANRQPDDLVVTRAGATVLVDAASLDLLAGAELDYTEELMGAHFAVRNPNAKSACGCGTSFSPD